MGAGLTAGGLTLFVSLFLLVSALGLLMSLLLSLLDLWEKEGWEILASFSLVAGVGRMLVCGRDSISSF